jgi:hypothetical protein
VTVTLEELRNLMRSKAQVAEVSGRCPVDAVVRSHAAERRHKRQPGACWAYVTQCADLKGRVATCHDSGDPRCAGLVRGQQ